MRTALTCWLTGTPALVSSHQKHLAMPSLPTVTSSHVCAPPGVADGTPAPAVPLGLMVPCRGANRTVEGRTGTATWRGTGTASLPPPSPPPTSPPSPPPPYSLPHSDA